MRTKKKQMEVQKTLGERYPWRDHEHLELYSSEILHQVISFRLLKQMASFHALFLHILLEARFGAAGSFADISVKGFHIDQTFAIVSQYFVNRGCCAFVD